MCIFHHHVGEIYPIKTSVYFENLLFFGIIKVDLTGRFDRFARPRRGFDLVYLLKDMHLGAMIG